MWALEHILKRKIIFAFYIMLVDIVVFICNSGDAYALSIAFFVDDEAGEVVLGVAAGVEGEEVQSSLCACAEKLKDDLGELDQLGVFLEISNDWWILIDVSQLSG